MISLRTFAKHLGISPTAVQKAVADGRLSASVTKDQRGATKLKSVAAAEREWNASDSDSPTTSAFQTARAAREAETAGLQRLKREAAELELARQRGELVPAAEVRAALVEEYAAVKAKLGAIPTRAKAEMPHLGQDDVARLQRLIDEALAELADEDVAEGAAA